jgi:hypothetical protein
VVSIDGDELRRELRKLRKGRAALHEALPRRVGPQIKELCGIEDADGAGAVRAKLLATVQSLLQREPKEVVLQVLAALALHPQADQRLLGHREAWLARRLHLDVRTVRRHVDEAFDRLVELATRDERYRVPPTPRSYVLKSLRALLRLDVPNPELTEHRRLLFVQEGVSLIESAFGLPRSQPAVATSTNLEVEVLYGGRLRSLEPISEVNYRLVVELPQPFHKGQEHEYGLVFRTHSGIRPHYVVQPVTPCELLEVRVRFDLNKLPAHIWRLDGTPLRAVDDRAPNAPEVLPDSLGECALSFHDLLPSLTYGLKWAK